MALEKSPLARRATNHWIYQQIASVVLIPLSLYVLITFFTQVVLIGGNESAANWLRSPLNGAMMLLFLGVGFFHGANGLIGIVEDYVHHKMLNRPGILAVKLGAWVLALAGISSVLKIMLGS